MDTAGATHAAARPFRIRTRPLAAPHHPARDAAFVAAAFDACVPHCAARGSGGMWGDRPFTERDPAFVDGLAEWVVASAAFPTAAEAATATAVAAAAAAASAGGAGSEEKDEEEEAGGQGEKKPAVTRVFIAEREVRASDLGLGADAGPNGGGGEEDDEEERVGTTADGLFYRTTAPTAALSPSSSSVEKTAGYSCYLLQLGAAVAHHNWLPGYIESQPQLRGVLDSISDPTPTPTPAPGFIMAEPMSPSWVYVEVMVSDVRAPETLRKGVGAALLTGCGYGVDDVRTYARQCGAQALLLDAWSGNEGRLVR